MQETYTVIEIFERDYGCEEREAGQEDLVQVKLRSKSGQESVLLVSDASLYEQDIKEGLEVFLIEGKLQKVLGADWVQACSQSMDVPGFLKQMDRLRSGETTICPFCGGVVFMTASENGKDTFSCDSCDMYFSTECTIR